MEQDYVTKKEFHEATHELREVIQKNGVFIESLENKIDTVIEMLGMMYEKVSVHDEKLANHEERIQHNTLAIQKLQKTT